MTAFLAAYAAGIVAFTEIAVPLIALARKRPAGRHRARGRMSWSAEIALRASNEVSRIRKYRFRELVAEAPGPAFLDVAPLCPPMYPPIGDREGYAHRLGVGRYAHLSPGELDATAERKLRIADFEQARREQVVNLAALRVRGGVPTVAEVDDEWFAAVSA